MKIKNIAVLGAGTMGNGIAQVCAACGFEVRLYDVEQKFLDRGLERIAGSLARLVKKEKITPQEAEKTRARIQPTLELEAACREVELVIEAAPEVMELKKELFRKVNELAPAAAILASNTSQLSVTELAAASGRPERFIGMHWFNPPPLMQLIEIVVALQTSEETLETIKELSRSLGKVPVVCKDAKGFITSRALTAFLVECYRIWQEGLASAEDIDTAIRLGLNHPMGPMQLSDLIGLDTIAHICRSLAETYGERFLLPEAVANLVRAGRVGAKAGRGFYEQQKK
jgi:3-hydroxybutyryl-CoA dehydrogenase